MQDIHQRLVVPRLPGEGDGIIQFAAQVVGLLAARGGDAGALRDDLVQVLVRAVTTEAPGALQAALRDLRRERITLETLADLYIPAAARWMGEAWLDDRLGFAEVSIGSARLQAILREIGNSWTADGGEAGQSGLMLVIVPEREQHTLGAMVLMGQLRRLGISVCLRFGPGPAELSELLRARNFSGVMISVAQSQQLDVLRGLVKTLNRLGPPGLPIIVGGAVVGRVGDVQEQTGADLVTCDLAEAVRACGLAVPFRSTRKRA